MALRWSEALKSSVCPGLGDDVADIDGFALSAFDQCFLNVGHEEVGDDTGVQAARSNDDDICICNGLQGLAGCSDLILFQAHFAPLAHADFNLSCFGIYDALECAVFAIEFAQECVVGDEIRPLEWWFVGFSDHPFGIAMFAICQFGANIDVVSAGGENGALYVQHVAGCFYGGVKIAELLREGGHEKIADVVVLKNTGFLFAVGKAVLEDVEKSLRYLFGVGECCEGIANVAGGLDAQIPADAPGGST